MGTANTAPLLLVEDNPDHTELLQQLVADHLPDTRLVVGRTYSEGLQLHHQYGCALVLVNAQLGRRYDETALTDFLLVVAPVPIIVLTESADPKLGMQLVQMGASCTVPKQRESLVTLPGLIERGLRQRRKESTSEFSLTTTQSVTTLIRTIEQQLAALPQRVQHASAVRTELALLHKELALLRAVLGSLVPGKTAPPKPSQK